MDMRYAKYDCTLTDPKTVMSQSMAIARMPSTAPVEPLMSGADTFCFDYFSHIKGIKCETIVSLMANGFDSIHTVLAIDVDTDLVEMRDMSLGQKCLLKKAIKDLNERYHRFVSALVVTPEERRAFDAKTQLLQRYVRQDMPDRAFPVNGMPVAIDANPDVSVANGSAINGSFKTALTTTREPMPTPVLNGENSSPKRKRIGSRVESHEWMTQPSCCVCGESAVGKYWSCYLCNGCHIFVGRALRSQLEVGECVNGSADCAIDVETRKTCRYCRFHKATNAGLTPPTPNGDVSDEATDAEAPDAPQSADSAADDDEGPSVASIECGRTPDTPHSTGSANSTGTPDKRRRTPSKRLDF
ncbi:unnamed protein product [Oppiella nova]|uniref:Nuclear receptor domain-containing protein n=1 Tax=Oppiella nova TaxID=334625 RepID=A0A7R9M2T3_9ACAR|nr:unnamed protein product [Oppiella nova]CAG2169663.1 unnamed protein product [Oppiella nova]